MIEYVQVPDEMDFTTKFNTYIIAYCPDTCEWFVTNNRFFYYEYNKEFDTEEAGAEYFRANVKEFYDIEMKYLCDYRPSFLYHKVLLSDSKNECIEFTIDN